MPATQPGPADTARAQYKANARRLAVRLDHLAKQILLDLAGDRPSAGNGRDAASIAVDLYVELKVLGKHDETAARARRAAA